MKKWFDARMFILVIAVAFIAAAYAPAAEAESYMLNWTNPTQYDDGASLDPATDIDEIQIFCDGDALPTYTITTHPTTSLEIDVSPGDHTCYGIVVDNAGIESMQSALLTFNVAPARPNPIIWGSGASSASRPGGG